MEHLTEEPWLLTGMCLIVAAFVAWNAMRSGIKKVWQLAGIVFAIALVPLIIDQLVETDREKVESTLMSLTKSVVDGDVEKALSFVEGADALPGSARETIERGLDQLDIHDDLRIVGTKIDVKDGTATSEFRANGTVDVKNFGDDQHAATRWRLTWKQQVGDWKITNVERLNPLSGDVMGTYSAK